MTELERRLQASRALLEPEIAPADTERALRRFKELGARRRRRRVVGLALAPALAGGLLALWGPLTERRSPDPEASGVDAEGHRVVSLADGSQAVLLDPRTELQVEGAAPAEITLRLRFGEARFDVRPDAQRRFRVLTQGFTVEVVGTRFTVTERPELSRVEVLAGRVRVLVGEERHELEPGMSFAVDPRAPPVPEAAAAPMERAEAPAIKAPAGRPPRRARSERAAPLPVPEVRRRWSELAQAGQMEAAYRELAPLQEGLRDSRELLLAADVARLTGHPGEAAALLERVLDQPGDPRAVLAAFTLGRLYLGPLSDAARCARAFAAARRLEPSGSLSEDALAHEVDCRARGGEQDTARALAREYLGRYPEGRRTARMRRYLEQE